MTDPVSRLVLTNGRVYTQDDSRPTAEALASIGNRIVAVAMVRGPGEGLRELAGAEAEPALAGHHRVEAVRAHLLDIAGDREAASAAYRLAARRTLSLPERRYLESRAAAAGTAQVQGRWDRAAQ